MVLGYGSAVVHRNPSGDRVRTSDGGARPIRPPAFAPPPESRLAHSRRRHSRRGALALRRFFQETGTREGRDRGDRRIADFRPPASISIVCVGIYGLTLTHPARVMGSATRPRLDSGSWRGAAPSPAEGAKNELGARKPDGAPRRGDIPAACQAGQPRPRTTARAPSGERAEVCVVVNCFG